MRMRGSWFAAVLISMCEYTPDGHVKLPEELS